MTRRPSESGGGGDYSPDREERAFLDLINNYRRKNGVGKLSLQNQLGACAEHHSQDMANKNYFSHKLSNGDSPEKNIERFGDTNWSYVGENIAAGYETAKAVMKAWKSSPRARPEHAQQELHRIGLAPLPTFHIGWYPHDAVRSR